MKLPTDYTKLTIKERRQVREQYIEAQEGKCLYCKNDLNSPAPSSITGRKIDWTKFPDDFLAYPIHLQHNHWTNMTEGAVHSYCNAVMWQY